MASPLAEAFEANGAATRAFELTLGIRAGPWQLAVALTAGLLSDAPGVRAKRRTRLHKRETALAPCEEERSSNAYPCSRSLSAAGARED